MALAGGAAGVDVEQLCGAVAHLFGRLAFGLFPLATAKLVQRCFIRADAGVAADQLQLAYRHVQGGLVRIFQVQKLLHLRLAIGQLVAQVQVDQATVAANAVGRMHHRVAHLEFAQVFDERFNVAHLFLLFAPAGGRAGGKQLGLGHEVNASL